MNIEKESLKQFRVAYLAGIGTGLLIAGVFLAIISLAGCVTDSEGNTRFDAEAFDTVAKTGAAYYDRYRATPAPYYAPVQPNPYANPYAYPRY